MPTPADIVSAGLTLFVFTLGFAVGYSATPRKLPSTVAIIAGLVCGVIAVAGLARLFV